jgi:hypothetical protein
MKKIIVLLLTLFCNNVAANCNIELTNIFTKLRNAANLVILPYKPQGFNTLKFSVVDLGSEVFAKAGANNNHMLASYELCKEPHAFQVGTIAHEFGHLIAYIIWPTLYTDAYIKNSKISYETHESYADRWGAKVFSYAEINSDEFLFFMDTECRKGNEYNCRAASNWRIGLID